MGEGDNGESRYWGKEIIGKGLMGEEDRKGRGYTEKGKRNERKREKISRGEVDERRNEEKGILGEGVEQREQSRHS